MHQITSTQNTEIKNIVTLRNGRKRKRSGFILVEGEREIRRALISQYRPSCVYWCPEKISPLGKDLFKDLEAHRTRSISEACFEKIAVREDSDGLLVIFHEDTEVRAKSFRDTNHKTVLILDHIEKPGNIGALLRSADGSGIDSVIVIGSCDTFGPHVIRTSLGTVFHLPVQHMTFEECYQWCLQQNLQIVLADPGPQALPYHQIDWTQPSALVIGNEANGLSQEWKNLPEKLTATIPMRGIADSLNASVAGAIMMYEATKNR